MSEYPYQTISETNQRFLLEGIEEQLRNGYDLLNEGEIKLFVFGALKAKETIGHTMYPEIVYSVTMKISDPKEDPREIQLLVNEEVRSFTRSSLREELLHLGVTEERIDELFNHFINLFQDGSRFHPYKTLEDFKK